MTGVNIFLSELAANRLELFRELVPAATRVAVLVNPVNAVITETTLRDVDAAARSLGLQIQAVRASPALEINSAFAAFARERPDVLFVSGDPFFLDRRVQLANLASHHSIPVGSGVRGIAETGGLISYGASLSDAYRQLGVYAGRILKGAKPADLPIVQSTKFELVINAQTARMLSLTMLPSLLARADEVIEGGGGSSSQGWAVRQRRGQLLLGRSNRRCQWLGPRQQIIRRSNGPIAGLSPRPQGDGLRRRRERHD
jgi:putative ABC transport system substrate-binding protein